MQLAIQHKVTYRYEPGDVRVALRLKMYPATYQAQNASDWTVRVNDHDVQALFTDAAGDALALWHSQDVVEEVVVESGGTVTTTDRSGIIEGLSKEMAPPIYLRETRLTAADEAIRELADAAKKDDKLACLHALSSSVREAIAYRRGATEVDTTAAEALARGAGVCQDHAHLFISAARCLEIPARYVVGYFLDPDSGDESDNSHAWAEAFVPGLGWIGFDVTNELCPTERYVRLVSGFDAGDAAPIRGTVFGEAEEEMTTEVMISASMSQSQQ